MIVNAMAVTRSPNSRMLRPRITVPRIPLRIVPRRKLPACTPNRLSFHLRGTISTPEFSGRMIGFPPEDFRAACSVVRSERMPLSFLGQKHFTTFERVGQNLSILPMHQDHALRIACLDEANEVIVACVRAEVELLPLALDVDRDAVQIDHAFFDEPPAVRPFDLVAGQEDRASRILANFL